MKIAFFSTTAYDSKFFDEINQNYHFDIHYYDFMLDSKTVELAENFQAVCLFVNDIADAQVIQKLIHYKVGLIALRCAGFNNIDLNTAYQKIHVVNVPQYSPHAVAEFTIGLMLNLNRKIHRAYLRSLEHNFSIENLLGFDMCGKTVGIIGLGRIGKIVSKILKGFDMRVIAHEAEPDFQFATQNEIELVNLETLYKQSDIITIHCPLTPKTHHLINEHSLNKMKDGVMLINTGRGGIIHSKHLINALKKNKLGSVGLDVYEEERHYFHCDFSDKIIRDDVLARLLTFPNVLITSHQAFFTQEALTNIAKTTMESLKAFEEGRALVYEISLSNRSPCK